jgi:hypothetical protein
MKPSAYVFPWKVATAAVLISVGTTAAIGRDTPRGDPHEVVVSLEWLGQCSSSLVVKDLDGDDQMTMDDLAIALALRINTLAVPDMDGDNQITAVDTVLLIEHTILSSMNDVNGDKIVNAEDATLVSAAFSSSGENLMQDVTGDNVVTVDDLIKVVENQGFQVSTNTLALSYALYGRVVNYDAMEAIGQLQIVTGIFDFDNWPDGNHLIAVSNLYPPSHGGWTSDGWLPNHLASITASWYPCPVGCHGTLNSRDEQWPPNHSYNVSKDWSPQNPPGHTWTTTRATPPAPHVYDVSRLWKNKPNHTISISSSYPPTHAEETSSVWPPNHNTTVSGQHIWPDPTNHDAGISAGWTHNTAVSTTWPPSHTSAVSTTWVPGHSSSTSVGWPPSHSSFASASWPPDTYPGTWPPNHHGGVSRTWGDPPAVPPGLWPPGHAYIPSVLEVIPLIPGGSH